MGRGKSRGRGRGRKHVWVWIYAFGHRYRTSKQVCRGYKPAERKAVLTSTLTLNLVGYWKAGTFQKGSGHASTKLSLSPSTRT